MLQRLCCMHPRVVKRISVLRRFTMELLALVIGIIIGIIFALAMRGSKEQ